MSELPCWQQLTVRAAENLCSAGRSFLCACQRFVDSLRDKREPSSGGNDLSPSLLTCLHDFVHVPRWPDLENVAIRQSRMLADELYSMIHVPRLKDYPTLSQTARQGRGNPILELTKGWASPHVFALNRACLSHDAVLQAFHQTNLRPGLGTQESTAALSPGMVPSTRRTNRDWT